LPLKENSLRTCRKISSHLINLYKYRPLFTGVTIDDVCFLALRHLAKRFGLTVDDAHLVEMANLFAAGELESSRLKRLPDHGSSGAESILVEFVLWFDKEEAEKLLRGGRHERSQHIWENITSFSY